MYQSLMRLSGSGWMQLHLSPALSRVCEQNNQIWGLYIDQEGVC